MFVGGGVGGVWCADHEAGSFYQGYGQAEINLTALTYYRYERIVQDIGEICEEVMKKEKGGEDRAVMLEQCINQFEPGNVVDIAYATDRKLQSVE